MKILMLNNEFPPLGGGTGTVNLELLKQFAINNSYKIDLITSTTGKKKEITRFSENITIFKYPVSNKNIHHSTNKELIIYTLKSFCSGFRKQLKNKYDLCFAWSGVPSGWNALLFNFFFRLPYIVRIGGADIPGFEQRYRTVYFIIKPMIKLIWLKSSFLIVKCEEEKNQVQKIDQTTPIRIIHNGIDLDKFKPTTEKKENAKINLICVARLIKRKGIDVLLKAIKECGSKNDYFKLLIIGTGDDEGYLKNLVIDWKLESLVEFAGYIERQIISAYYAKSDIFVLPSFNEGMSNSVLEAMACGLPVIVTNTGGTKELVKDNENGFIFEAGNWLKLKNILEGIIQNRDQLIAMGYKSRQIAENHSWNKIFHIYEEVIKEV